MAKQQDSSYKTEDLSNGQTRFIVTPGTPASSGAGCISVIFGVILAFLVGELFRQSSDGTQLFFAIVTFIGIAFVMPKLNAQARTKLRGVDGVIGGDFLVSSKAIEVNGQTLQADKIHRLVLRNAISGDVIGGSSFIVGGGTGTAGAVVGASMAVGTALANASQQVAAATRAADIRVGYLLGAELGGKRTILATGMDETTAFGLLTDVSKILGFTSNG